MLLRHLLEEVGVGRDGDEDLLVDQREESMRPRLEQHGHRRVVGKLEDGALDALGAALGLLHTEDVLVEELLQLLVGEVDQELLEAVAREALETEDVEQPWLGLGLGLGLG